MKTLLVVLAIAVGVHGMGYSDTGPEGDGWTIDPLLILAAAGSVAAGSIVIIGGSASGGTATSIGTGSAAAMGAMAAAMVASDELAGKIGPVIGPYDAEKAMRFIQEY